MKTSRIVLILAWGWLLVACLPTTQSGDATTPATSTTETPIPANTSLPSEVVPVTLDMLEGTKWVLFSNGPMGTEQSPLAEAPITLAFANQGELFGSAGCNSYFANFTLDGVAIQVGPLSQTDMACPAGAIEEQEGRYLQAVAAAQTISLDETMLLVGHADGVLRFVAEPPPPVTILTDSFWQLSSFTSGTMTYSPLNGTIIVGQFAEGMFTGYAGCNWFGAAFTVEGEQIGFAAAERTARDCLGEGVVAQEETFLQALSAAATYTLVGDQLTIQYEGGALNFQAVPDPSGPPFTGTTWVLWQMNYGDDGSRPQGDTPITTLFSGGQLSGSGGCNSYFADYTADGLGLSIGPIGATKMACAEPITSQESQFFAYLASARTLAVSHNLLLLIHDDGVMAFVPEGSR